MNVAVWLGELFYLICPWKKKNESTYVKFAFYLLYFFSLYFKPKNLEGEFILFPNVFYI